MSSKINRRCFIKKSAVVSAASTIGNFFLPNIFYRNVIAEPNADLVAVKGENYFEKIYFTLPIWPAYS